MQVQTVDFQGAAPGYLYSPTVAGDLALLSSPISTAWSLQSLPGEDNALMGHSRPPLLPPPAESKGMHPNKIQGVGYL